MSHLSHEGVCAIVKACIDGGVLRLKFGALEIEFGPPCKCLSETDRSETHHTVPVSGSDERKARLSDLRERVEAELDGLMIEDPAAYERFMTGEGESERGQDDRGTESAV